MAVESNQLESTSTMKRALRLDLAKFMLSDEINGTDEFRIPYVAGTGSLPLQNIAIENGCVQGPVGKY